MGRGKAVMNFELIWEPRGVVIRFFGKISIKEIQEASVAYQSDWRFDGLLYVIADYTEIESCDARPNEIEYVWAIDSGAKYSNHKIRKAIVTTTHEVIQLATHYKNRHGKAFEVEIFPTQADARTWLNFKTGY